MRTLVAALLASLVAVPLTPGAADAAATCRGQDATIEASEGVVTGTPGNDVIVVTGAVRSVSAGDGTDLVCLVDTTPLPRDRTVYVGAGAGSDVIDASRAGADTSVQLGPGADSLVGSPFDDYVRIGGSNDAFLPIDAGPYVVTGRGGDDTLVVVGAGPVITARMGRGADAVGLDSAVAGPGSVFDLGRGRDRVTVEDRWGEPGAGEASLLVDLPHDRLTWREVTSELVGAEWIQGLAERVTILGDAENNRFFGHGCRVDLRGGAGDDQLELSSISAGELAPDLSSCEPTTRLRARGNRGDDYLEGGKRHDVLIGGLGRDRAFGGPSGDDRCDAEIVAGKGCRGV